MWNILLTVLIVIFCVGGVALLFAIYRIVTSRRRLGAQLDHDLERLEADPTAAPATIECNYCGKKYPTEMAGKSCPDCGAPLL